MAFLASESLSKSATEFAYSIRRSRRTREIRILGRPSLQHLANVAHTLAGRSLTACGLLARNARRAAALPMSSHRPRIPVEFAIMR